MTLYCTVHKNEDQQALMGLPLDFNTNHMVYDKQYDLNILRNALHSWKVIWQMERVNNSYIFKELVGIPH